MKKNTTRVATALGTMAAATSLAACAPDTSVDNDNQGAALNVHAASSTRVLNDALSEDFADKDISFSFHNAGSSDLVTQLAEGAPSDLLVTASRKTMDDAVENGSVEEPEVLATNQLVMVVPKGNPAGINSVEDLTDEHRLVLCDPQVPCGDLSQQIIEKQGLDLTPVSQEHQVADVLGKVTSGEADAGWVYSTDAQSAGDDVEVIEIAGSDEFTNELLGAVTKNSEHPEQAAEVLDHLADDFDETWRDFGFKPA
ncbi:Molybdenum ABC transporter, periplasmic molybdate-binding protein [Corynebacterium camporealensis]|uniref:Molybdenum ABC transporter, periplasmic molybdate-binding protein n=1 Tax=Corynebacterium camporealensis TaxID=161896 RepID=A0A0F6TAU6_9CORY|nr:molybdate ABC transporter substrate-binding protein [Corynebacterium camporealensis]AKE38946.1 molybdenum ABC transporter, periplasmic molybdate-binding protein [Corynebacterium camporealensis]AVH88191.1 Molybdenum ABC transporter, periplasmic molybdate-binding protein [Corynebacterium camporealensis]